MRVKRGTKARKRRNRILRQASGFVGRSGSTLKQATQRTEKAMTYAYAGRKIKKRDYRSLWITRINAAAREHGLSYSKLIAALKKANIQIDRKILAGVAFENPAAFKAVVESARATAK